MWLRNNVERRHHLLAVAGGGQSLSLLERRQRQRSPDSEKAKVFAWWPGRNCRVQTFTPAVAGACLGAVARMVWRAIETIALSLCSSGMFFTIA